MNKRLILIVCGLALIVGLYVWDRDNSTIEVMAATVSKIEQIDTVEGPDKWQFSVLSAQGDVVALSGIEDMPVLSEGDTICIEKITRTNFPPEYRRAARISEC